MRLMARSTSCLAILAASLAFHSRAATEGNTDQLGQVSFPTSCEAQAQPILEKGLALLHSFQYTQSEETFSDAAKRDPRCAMAYWGKAMARYHQLWDFPQPGTLREGWQDVQEAQKLNASTERERGYIAAAAAFYQDDAKLIAGATRQRLLRGHGEPA